MDGHRQETGRPSGGGRVFVTIVVALLAFAGFLDYRGDIPGLPLFEHDAPVVRAAPAPRPPLDPDAVAAGISPVLVNVTAAARSFGPAAAGSGIIVSPDGQVLTSHHVVKGANSVRVTRVADGAEYQAEVLGYDSAADIALLSLAGARDLPAARIGSSAQLRVQDQVLAIGNAGGTGSPTAVAGPLTDLDSAIIAFNAQDMSRKALSGMLEIEAPVSSGQSGGALADHGGAVVGVIAAASGEAEEPPPPSDTPVDPPTGYAVPIDTAMRVVRQIRSGIPTDSVHIGPTATLGVLISDARPAGARIDVAIYGLPAQAAGLADGEIITEIDGRAVTSARALHAAINTRKPAETVRLGVLAPGGAKRTVPVVLAAGTPN